MLRCVIYLAVLSSVIFAVGCALPRNWFRADRFPWREMAWEREGRIYRKLGIHRWQKKLPDISRILPGLLPEKSLESGCDPEKLERMVQETCVAECVHWVLSLLGLWCLRLWRGMGGVVVAALFFLAGNLPYILVQRYNRPRLCRLRQRLAAQ